MSKKNKLKAQKERQDMLRRELEEQEELERQGARSRESKAAAKMRKSAARGGRERWWMIVLKLVMLVPYLYSGFFHGGVLAAGILMGSIEPSPPSWVCWCTVIGSAVILAGIVLDFCRKYIPGTILIAGGTVSFFRAAQYMIGQIQYRLENYSVRESLQGMDVAYMKRYYPILGCIGIAVILLILDLVRRGTAKRRRRIREENAPVKSIVD